MELARPGEKYMASQTISEIGGELTGLLRRYREGDRAARDRLIEFSYERFQRLASRMLDGFPKLRRWEQTGDVLNGAMMRLLRALEAVRPESSQHYLSLAAEHIRWHLLDLTRHHFGPQGSAAHHHTDGGRPPSDTGTGQMGAAEGGKFEGPPTLAEWTEFHKSVEKLPEELRAVVDLLWYGGLTQEQAATELEVDVRTVKRRWRAAREQLHDLLGGVPGGSNHE